MKGSLNQLRPTRTLALLVGVLCILIVRGQDASGFNYLIHFAQEVEPRQEKFLLEGLITQDPLMKMRMQPSAMSVHVRATVPLDLEILQDHVAPSGLQLQSIIPMTAYGPDGEVKDTGAPITPPVYIDTGDPQADMDRYAADKLAWRLAHPVEEVQDQIDPTPED